MPAFEEVAKPFVKTFPLWKSPPVPNAVSGPVSLTTRAGIPKRRFTSLEKLRLLGPSSPVAQTERRVAEFMRLFCPKRSNAITTRVGEPSGWTALRGLLYADHVVRHLLADTVPSIRPQWVGSRPHRTSLWFAL